MIEGYDVRSAGCDPQFHHHVILGIRKQRTPEEINRLLVGNLRNSPDDRLHSLSRDENSRIGADKNVVVFGE